MKCRTTFNFQYGPYTHDEPDDGDTVAMHIDIRYAEETVVKNHFEIDGWGDEEVNDFSSLQPGEDFVIEVKVTGDSYAIQINHIDVGEFKHRVPLQDVTHLFAFHDVIINTVSLDGQQLAAIN